MRPDQLDCQTSRTGLQLSKRREAYGVSDSTALHAISTAIPTCPCSPTCVKNEGIFSAKDGCAPQAACGCCVVDLDGKAVLACVTPMKKVAGGAVTTTEGLGEYRQEVFANAFVSKRAACSVASAFPASSCRPMRCSTTTRSRAGMKSTRR